MPLLHFFRISIPGIIHEWLKVWLHANLMKSSPALLDAVGIVSLMQWLPTAYIIDLPIVVFDMDTPGNLEKLLSGVNIGTLVSN